MPDNGGEEAARIQRGIASWLLKLPLPRLNVTNRQGKDKGEESVTKDFQKR